MLSEDGYDFKQYEAKECKDKLLYSNNSFPLDGIDGLTDELLCNYINEYGKPLDDHFEIKTKSIEIIQYIIFILKKFNIKADLKYDDVFYLLIYPENKNKLHFNLCNNLGDINIGKHDKLENKNEINYYKNVMFDSNDKVYDLTTESGTLNVNGMWTHNTGGAATMMKVDIFKEIIGNNPMVNEDKIKSIIELSGNDVLSKKPVSVTILLEHFTKKELEITDGLIHLDVPYFNLQETGNNEKFEIILNSPISFNILNEDQQVTYTDTELKIVFPEKKQVIGKIEVQMSNLSSSFKITMALLQARTKIFSPEQYFNKLYELYVATTGADADLVHYELLTGQVFRDKASKMPGRLNGYKNAEPVSIKKIPFMESWFLGLLFENAEKAIQEGLLYDTKSNTFLERLAAGYVGKRGDGGIK